MKLSGRGRIAVEGAELAYRVTGRGAPLVVLHGGPGLGYAYLEADLTRVLGSSYRLLFYDQRASGRSTGLARPELLTMAAFVEDLDAVRVAAGLRRIDVLGHSFGGLLALFYATTYPDRVASLILLDSDPASRELWECFGEIVEARRTDADRNALEAIQSVEGWSSDPASVERYLKIFLRAYFAEPELADGLSLGFDEHVLRNHTTTHPALRDDLRRYDIHERLERIACPTLILYGESSIFPPAAHRALHERIAGSRLVGFPGVGHFPHVEAPKAFAGAVREFLPAG